MSDLQDKTPAVPTAEKTPPPVKRHRVRRALAWIFGSSLLLLVILVAGLSFYTTTADFQRRVGAELVSVLEDSTGGKVEIGHISFSLWHLAVEADGLVIHGTEGPGEAPYLSAAKIFVRVRINTFLSHTLGTGAQSHIGVNFLRVEEPHVHLIITADGKTNQPVPKHKSTSTEPLQNTLLDLQASKVELANGLAVVNDRAIPFDLAANDLNAEVHYIPGADHYGATIDLADLRTRMQKQPEVQSRLHLTAEFGRDMAELKTFDFATGNNTHLNANALLTHFANPEWQATLQGGLDLRQIGFLAGLDGFTAGRLDLDVHGRNCQVTPQVAQKAPAGIFHRSHKEQAATGTKMLPPDANCKAGYLLVGSARLNGAGYRNPNVRLHDINAAAQLNITPTELVFNALTGYLPGGGSIEGDLRIENWLGEVPSDTPAKSPTTVAAATAANTAAKGVGAAAPVQSVNITPVQRAHAVMTVKVNRIPLRTILDITAPPHFGDLGLDTAITGPVKAEWGGPATEIADSVLIDANLQLAPAGSRRGAINVPVSGNLIGHFDGRSQVVNLSRLELRTPQTTLTAGGVLGVNKGDPLTNLQLNLQARDLGEFDRILQTVGFEANGKKGSAALPVVLHGTLGFVGSARGALRALDVKGRLNADNLAVHLGTTADVHIDSIVAEAEYSPANGIAVGSSTIKRGTAILNVAGTFRPHRIVSRRGVVTYAWDNDLGIDTSVKLANAQLADVLDIAGQQGKYPITGTLDLNGHAAGTLNNLSGAGTLALNNGVAYGENYQTISVDVNAQGQQINATRILVQAHGMSVTGNAAYNLASKHIQGTLQGNDILLSKLDTVQKANPGADGVLSFTASANGTVAEPNLNAKLSLAKITVGGKPIGELNATASSVGSVVSYDLHSTLVGAQLAANGHTALVGDYQTTARITLSGLDIANALTLFSPGTMAGATSTIAGTIDVNGPAAKPMQLTGAADFGTLDLRFQGVELKNVEPLRAHLQNGLVTLDKLHVTGPDTDLHAAGNVQVFGDANPLGGPINVTADGSINMALAHTFDPDLITSGKVSFKVAAGGRLKKPNLTGDVQFQNVNAAVSGIPNGLSNMNGTLVFNENRLDVKQLTATTGGGQLKIGGSLSYQKGIFADLTATGDAVRVRLYGLSATANASFRLQGGPQSVLLSGSVLVTRFGVGADVDFAAFGGTGGVQTPPDPTAASNKIRLDIHVTSAPQLDFQNSYAKLAGTVDLTVRGTVAVPSVLGRIQITDGSATFAGTKYQLNRGTIYFSNPVRIDPVIDLDASARVENYDITIGLHGTTTSLKPTYRSEPPLTEADIFNLLALGRTQEEAQLYQEQQIQSGTDPTTSALLGGALNATVSSRVNKLFGAGSVKIDPAFVGTLGNSTARITVQEPVTKQLTLVFATNVNQSAQQLIQVQYRIDDNTSLVATRDESGVFSIVYKLRKRYR